MDTRTAFIQLHLPCFKAEDWQLGPGSELQSFSCNSELKRAAFPSFGKHLQSQRVQVALWYIHRPQNRDTLRPKYVPCTFMDFLGIRAQGHIEPCPIGWQTLSAKLHRRPSRSCDLHLGQDLTWLLPEIGVHFLRVLMKRVLLLWGLS